MGIKGFRAWFESQFPSAIVAFSKEGAHEKFDHVLIDVNQILHTALRKAGSEGHGLVLLIKELDACIQMATPTQTLVLAMDGPPSAAKLATQRQRRKGVVVRSATKIRRLERVIELGKRRLKKSVLIRQKRKASADMRTLSITPGTALMETAAQAILYWAWQRMSNPTSPLHRVQVFLSPSSVPGEGEVKLLEWIYTKRRKDSSIAILGGDSDLVLEGLIIPPTSTHDIFVLLPDGPRKYLAVSLWETTRSLQKDYITHITMSNVMKIRTDLVVLFILNGNDYLPKLRGSSGFSKLFKAYKTIQNKWNQMERTNDAYLVDPDSLTLNPEFCLDFFSLVASELPVFPIADTRPDQTVSPMFRLYSLVDSGVLPKPVKFTIVDDGSEEDANGNDFYGIDENEDEESDPDEVDEENLAEDDSEEGNGHLELIRLSLGEEGTEDCHTYDLWWPKDKRLRSGQQRLAETAICDLLGLENPFDELEEGEDPTDESYDWEIQVSAESDLESYLYGILWNLQTYQDGICADYAYNYGKRKSPTAGDIAAFFEHALAENRTVGAESLSPNGFTPPIDAGLCCLAALPSTVRDLIPEPYSFIPEATVEAIYAECVDPEDNSFNITLFEKLCKKELQKWDGSGTPTPTAPYTSNNTWTVLSRSRKPLTHPFDPPPPFDTRFSKLRRDRWIRISQYSTIVEPRDRDKHHFYARKQKSRSGTTTTLPPIRHSSPGREFLKLSIQEVPHRSVYMENKVREPRARRGKDKSNQSASKDSQRERKKPLSIPRAPPSTRDNRTAMSCLKQLEDAGIFTVVQWEYTEPVDAVDPSTHERVSLKIHTSNTLHMFDDFEASWDREINRIPRKQIQQHLASIALENLLSAYSDKSWQEYSFTDIKSIITRTESVE